VMLYDWEGNHACLKVTQPTVVFMTHVSCRMTANRLSSSRVTSTCSTWNHPSPALRSSDLSQSAFNRALKTHLFSTAGAIWDVFMILATDTIIYTYLLTYLLTIAFQINHTIDELQPWNPGNSNLAKCYETDRLGKLGESLRLCGTYHLSHL